MNYYISDLHLLHEHCICFDERPFGDLEKMHETMDELCTKIPKGITE